MPLGRVDPTGLSSLMVCLVHLLPLHVRAEDQVFFFPNCSPLLEYVYVCCDMFAYIYVCLCVCMSACVYVCM